MTRNLLGLWLISVIQVDIWLSWCSFLSSFLGQNLMVWSHIQEHSKPALEDLREHTEKLPLKGRRWPARADSYLLSRMVSAMDLLLVVFSLWWSCDSSCFLTQWELLNVEAYFCWWEDSLSTNWGACSNSSADDQDKGLNVKGVPGKDRFSLASKSTLTENVVLPINIDTY